MTQREFLQTIVETVANDEIVAFAQKEIAKLDAKNGKRRNTESKKALENKPIKTSILNFLEGSNFTLCKDIAEGVDISTQKATALCKQLVDEGLLTVTDLKVKSRGVLKAYRRVDFVEVETDTE